MSGQRASFSATRSRRSSGRCGGVSQLIALGTVGGIAERLAESPASRITLAGASWRCLDRQVTPIISKGPPPQEPTDESPGDVEDRHRPQENLIAGAGARPSGPRLAALASEKEKPEDVFRGVKKGGGGGEGRRRDPRHRKGSQSSRSGKVAGGERRQGQKSPVGNHEAEVDPQRQPREVAAMCAPFGHDLGPPV